MGGSDRMASHPQRGSENHGFSCLGGGVARIGCARLPAQTCPAERNRRFLAASHYSGRGLDFLALDSVPLAWVRSRRQIEEERQIYVTKHQTIIRKQSRRVG